jgi:HD-GYP domain-containing protein (c-di-GMP phosphodiesterase class II)
MRKDKSVTQEIDIPSGQQFLQVFHLLINSARTYEDNNQTLQLSVRQFLELMQQLLEENDDVSLLFTGGAFYLQEERIVGEKGAASFTQGMHRHFEKRKLGGLRFYDSILQAPFAEITLFARLMSRSSLHEEPASWLEKKLDEEQLSWVEILGAAPVSSGQEKAEPDATQGAVAEGQAAGRTDPAEEARLKKRKNAMQTYGYTVLSLKDIAGKIGSDKKVSIKKTMRLVQNMIDMVVEDTQIFLSLSTIRDYDDYTFTHSMNVAILSVSLGHKIGLEKSILETLSLSALFHDLGKIDIPRHILNKQERLTEAEFQKIKMHSLDSVRRIIKLKTSRKKKIGILLPPFEHHLKYDLSGYPKTPRKKPLSLLGRIITIADVFDAITAPRIYRPTAISPDRALGYMLERAGTHFDPLLLKVFINMIGVYPIGTLLRFDNGEMGLVAAYHEDADRGRELRVQLLIPSGDGGFGKGELINLGSLDPKSCTFNRHIAESLHPADFDIQPAAFIL